MDSKQIAFTINGNEEFQLLFKRPENDSTNLNHSKNKVHVRMVHDGSKQMNRKVINIIFKNCTSLCISVNQRLSNVIFSHTDGCQGKVVDLVNVPYFVNQKALQTLVKENSYSSYANAKHLLRQEALSKMPTAVKSERYVKKKRHLETLYVTSEKKITPFYNVEAKKESGNESIAYEAIIILGKQMKKTTAAYNVDQQNVKLLMNFQIVLDLALSENIIPMYYELSSSNNAQETENHQYILILEKYGNFYGTGSSKADALEDAAGQALSSDVLKNKMKNLPGIVVAADDPSIDFGFESDFDIAVYLSNQSNLSYKYISKYDEQHGMYSGELYIGDEFSAKCRSVAYENCRSACGKFSLLKLKQWLPNLRWYACLLPNKRHKTRLLNQISANYEKMRKPGISKLIYRKNNNVNYLETILKVHKVNFTMTVSKGDLEVHIARCKVEKNGFSLIAEVVQKTQRDALELSAFTALEILLYSNMFPDVGNTIRSTLLKADPSV
ncbi:hypothetical protein T10_5759 [Trichinella papuae]|uniref:Uncharacterized protein n=1 Tax=Trichinella papuae TaxID=268474 RepID=A0A0V1MC01_9BILA|nr:hypothetical protein T10_5759 [Trichinella papuae]